MKNILLLSLLFLGTACKSSNESGGLESNRDSVTTDPVQAMADVHWSINNHRARLGLPALVRLPEMDREAMQHARDMSDGFGYGHGGMSRRCLEARRAAGGGNACGEIIAAGQDSAAQVMRSWLNSWDHRSRIEDPRYTRIGVGASVSRDGRAYWSVLFLQR